MHMIIDELLTTEQLTSPKRYIYEICEMFGWDFPDVVSSTADGFVIQYTEDTLGKAKKRQRLIQDGCYRRGTRVMQQEINVNSKGCYCCSSVIPVYSI